MFSTLVRKEFLHNMLNLRFALVTVLFVSLAVSATFTRSLLFNRIQKTGIEAAAERNRLDRENTIEMLHRQMLGHTIERAPNPLSVFIGGLDQEMTRTIRFAGTHQWFPGDITRIRLGNRAIDIPSMRIFYGLDMATVIALISSLLALLLVFDSISGEREAGTLKLALAGPLPRDTLILAKLFAGVVTILIPLAISWALAILCASLTMHTQFTAEDMLRLSAIAALSALYATVFFAAGMAMSIWFKRSATALGACLIVWIILVLAVPNLAPLVVRRFNAVPSSAKINLEHNTREKNVWSDHIPQWQKELALKGITNWPQQFPLLARMAEVDISEQISRLRQFQQAKLSSQMAAEGSVARASPAALFLFASANIAGTGSRDYQKFMNDVGRYRNEYLEARHEQWREWTRTYDNFFMYNPDKWPPFRSTRIEWSRVFAGVWPDVVILTSLAVLLFFLSYIGFIRMDLTQ